MSASPPKPTAPPLFVLGIAILAASTASIFIRYAQAYAPSLVIAAYRLALAILILLPVALLRYRAELRRLGRREIGLALLSGFFLALHFATWITSLQYTTVASSAVLVSTSPLWVALLSPITIKEKITRPALVGMLLALAGGSVVALNDACGWRGINLACPSAIQLVEGRAFLGDMLALTGGLMAALYLLIGRRLRPGMSLFSYVFVVYGMAAAVLVIIMLGSGEKATGYPPIAYLWLLLLALVPQLLGHSSFNWALRYLSAAYVSISLLGEPVGSTILAYFLLRESPGLLKIIGAILILAGLYIASRAETAPVPEPDLTISD